MLLQISNISCLQKKVARGDKLKAETTIECDEEFGITTQEY